MLAVRRYVYPGWDGVPGGGVAYKLIYDTARFSAHTTPIDTRQRALQPHGPQLSRHNHDPRRVVSAAQAHVLPLEVVDERYADIRKWTAAGVGHTDMFKLLEMDNDGKVLDKAGKRKASSSARVFLVGAVCGDLPRSQSSRLGE